MQETQLREKIDQMEKDLKALKQAVFGAEKKKHRVSLKGMLKGVKIEESDIEEAKKSLFPGDY